MDAIRISNLVKKYGTVTAVEDLSLSVPAGTMFGLLGPTAGEIEVLGERFNAENSAIKRRMGVMPETLGLFDPLYAHEFLAFVARMYGVREDETRRRVAELLQALELT